MKILLVWKRDDYGEIGPTLPLYGNTWEELTANVKEYVLKTKDDIYEDEKEYYEEFYENLSKGVVDTCPELNQLYILQIFED